MPNVYNKHIDKVPDDAIYIGRPSAFGNPFNITEKCTRFRAICRYEAWVKAQPDLMQKIRDELRGKDLVCHCSPKPCHGDFLLRIANEKNIFEDQ